MREQGIQVVEASSAILQFVTLTSPNGSLDEIGLGDVATRNVLPELRRLPGVGRARLFSTERAMRIWLDPDEVLGLSPTAGDVDAAIRVQNALLSSGLAACSGDVRVRGLPCSPFPRRPSPPPPWASALPGRASRANSRT